MRLTDRQKSNLRNLNKKAEDKIEALKRSGVIDLDFKIKRGYFRSEKAYREYRKEVNNMLSAATSQYQFVSIGSGKKISKATKANLQSFIKEINKNKKTDWDKIKNKSVKTGQGDQKITELAKYGMGNTKYASLVNKRKLNLNSIDSKSRLKNLEKRLKETSTQGYIKIRKQEMRDNFIEGMKTNGFPESAIDKVQKLSGEKFYNWYMTHDVDFADFAYKSKRGQTSYNGDNAENEEMLNIINTTL